MICLHERRCALRRRQSATQHGVLAAIAGGMGDLDLLLGYHLADLLDVLIGDLPKAASVLGLPGLQRRLGDLLLGGRELARGLRGFTADGQGE